MKSALKKKKDRKTSIGNARRLSQLTDIMFLLKVHFSIINNAKWTKKSHQIEKKYLKSFHLKWRIQLNK